VKTERDAFPAQRDAGNDEGASAVPQLVAECVARELPNRLEEILQRISPGSPPLNPVQLDDALRALGRRLLGNNPQPGYFAQLVRDHELVILNIKNLGYELGRSLAAQRLNRVVDAPVPEPLKSKLCVQSDLETDWFAFWCRELRTAPVYHRKIWEFCYICQVLWSKGKLAAGSAGLGFGCGEEPLPALFAKYGARILATDLDAGRPETAGWRAAGLHASSVDVLRHRDVCPDEHLLANIAYRPIDMNAIPVDLQGRFDFCWSSCALEHLGSLASGMDFVEQSLRTLKPGGVAVHTTEFTFDAGDTIDDWPTVLYQERHMRDLAARLQLRGYEVADFDFSRGTGVLDAFVDLPPSIKIGRPPRKDPAHLRLSYEGFTCTSAGIIITCPT